MVKRPSATFLAASMPIASSAAGPSPWSYTISMLELGSDSLEVPEEEKNPSQNDRLIHVYHFAKDSLQNQIQNFGDPFFLAIREGETLAEVKSRIQRKLQVPDEEFSKWKFAFISMNRPDYLQDSDVVSARFQRRDVYGAWEQYLGLEHTDTAPKRAYTANQDFVQSFAFLSNSISS
ncbi:unnamed protein product [Triticum turgidum subsp. durum]|uniref:ubiquitinyl hydrolase 1 n=1 Tax=Triticum turgidum subsp. durum TaxID=4567 RepID=A0A9R0VXZ0_TRITD|nr:unnamed protein product [Triticum turgidum subsp. durum]